MVQSSKSKSGSSPSGAPVPGTAMLRDHILKEQDGVFPAALANLGTEEWEAVEAEPLKVGGALSRPAA